MWKILRQLVGRNFSGPDPAQNSVTASVVSVSWSSPDPAQNSVTASAGQYELE